VETFDGVPENDDTQEPEDEDEGVPESSASEGTSHPPEDEDVGHQDVDPDEDDPGEDEKNDEVRST
jgi:hypothetical protein